MKKLVFAVISLACGVSPEDAANQLDAMVADPPSWCGFEEPLPQEVDKAFNHPDGYGLTGDVTGCDMTAESWPGGYCWAPHTEDVRFRIYTDGQETTWMKRPNDEFGAVRDALNARGWNLTKWAAGNPTEFVEVHTGTTHPNGWLGYAVHSGFVATQMDPGFYMTYNHCTATLYRTAIEANAAYQSASSTEKDKYLKNLWSHEYGHCLGLPHNLAEANKLMSVTYSFPGPMFSNNLNYSAEELSRFAQFDPLN